MIKISLLLNSLKSRIVRRRINLPELSAIHGIVFLDGPAELSSDYLYLGETDSQISWLREYTFPEPVTLFLDGDNYLADPLFKNKKLNLIITEMGILSLYNCLNSSLSLIRDWTSRLTEDLCRGENLPAIVEHAADRLKGYIFLMNPGYKVIAGTSRNFFPDALADELKENGYLSYASVQEMNRLLGEQTSAAENQSSRLMLPISVKNRTAAFLLFILNDTHRDLDALSMITSMGNLLSPLLSQNQGTLPTAEDSFRLLLSDLEKGRLSNSVEIRERFRQLACPPDKYIYCMIIDCPDSSIPEEYLLNQLQSVLPGANLACWKGEFVALFSAPQHFTKPADLFDPDRLNELLKTFGGKALVSSATSHAEKFKTLYQLCHRMLFLLRKMDMPSEYESIYLYSDYAVYLVIDFCAKYYQTLTGHSDIILLANPAIIKLTRYDKAHKTELCDVLFYYLLNGRNVAKTAKGLYMHRNTVLNKLNRIDELIHLPLDDGQIQQHLLFSCQIARYYTRVLALELNL